MDKLNKYTILAITITIVVFLLVLLASTVSENITKTKIASTGLEQCLANPSSMNAQTIWVKSCKDYLQAIKGYNEN